jgi:predicted molibdopterin-dependent oxidoreductase YjgC
MFTEPVRGWADLVLPGTSYLERDGTYVNLEGRLQRLRRAVIPPAPDELAWIAKLAERFGVELEPHASGVSAEVSPLAFGGVAFGPAGEHAPLPPRAKAAPPPPTPAPPLSGSGGPLRLIRYRALFSGSAVERVPELQFQRPGPIVELAPPDAEVRGIEEGQTVSVSSNGMALELRARINPRLVAGAVRAAEEHVRGLGGGVEVSRI